MRNARRLGAAMLMLASAFPHASAASKDKPGKQDQIDVLANVAVDGGRVTRLTITRHYNRSYLYIEHASRALTLLDVTDARHPKKITQIDAAAAGSGSVVTAAGDAALISSDPPAPSNVPEKSLRIVSFADPSHPKTIREFQKVTCTALDEPRNLIYLANEEGLWILHRNSAVDPDVQERYAHDVIYNH